MQTIQTLASHYSDFLIAHRMNPFLICTDNTPQNFREFIYKIHDEHDLAPNDYIYAFIKEALETISDTEDCEDVYLEAEAWDWELIQWYGSNGNFRAIVDEIFEEYKDFNSVINIIRSGQESLKNWIKDNCINFLRDELDKLEEAA